jgi:hypothetical protein
MQRSRFARIGLILLGVCFVVVAVRPFASARDNDAAAAKGSRPFTDRFDADKKELASTGTNPYFSLQPGDYLVLEKKGAKIKRLTVTVLNETKMIDGVETRVVEELETVDGKEVERSRNYFAICRRTNNVYYFGEDTGGAWESGVNGARFGLAMPGTPLLGARYHQEVAPGVAMDRGEVVSLTETLQTPAGRFENCLKVEETTPLEPDEREHKLFARGVGLIYDEGMTLVEHGRK